MESIVGTTQIEKVWAAKARENYAAILNEVAPPKLEDVILGLEKHFEAKTPTSQRTQCDICFGWSDENLPSCPYCDDGKATEVAPPKPAPAPSAAIVETKRSKSKPASSAPSLLVGGRVTLTEKDLDEEIRLFNEDAKISVGGAYRMGKRLIRFRDELWMLRTEEGKPKYKSYNQFVEAELDMGVGYANKVRRIAEVFTFEQFIEHGPQALKALIAAPKEFHDALLARHKEGATAADIDRDVKEIREKGGIAVIETEATKSDAAKARKTAEASAAAAAARKKEKETAVATIGLKAQQGTIDLLARPAKKGEEPREAREVADQPFGLIEGINGKKLFLAVKKKPSGSLQIKWTVQDEDDEK